MFRILPLTLYINLIFETQLQPSKHQEQFKFERYRKTKALFFKYSVFKMSCRGKQLKEMLDISMQKNFTHSG